MNLQYAAVLHYIDKIFIFTLSIGSQYSFSLHGKEINSIYSSKDNSGETAVVDAQNILYINRTLLYIHIAICMYFVSSQSNKPSL